MRATATPRPAAVLGYMSPYPTVVTVVAAHQMPSGMDVILESAAPRSISATRIPAPTAASQ